MSDFIQFNDLKNASVFITGGGSGIGASLTEGFLQQGCKVSFVDKIDAANFVLEMVEKYSNPPLFIRCDISDIPSLKEAIDKASKVNGTISILINNAADDSRHSLYDTNVHKWERSMHVNLRPHFFSTQAVAPGMKKIGGGSIVNFSSVSYMLGLNGYPTYVTAKAAITGLTRALARELGQDNIRVNALMPGWVLTKRQLDLWASKEDLENQLKIQCIKRHLEPNDIVEPTLFLASKASKMMTGQALVIDGGVTVTG